MMKFKMVKMIKKRFNCDFEGCEYSYKSKKTFGLHFKAHFTDSTCKKCGKTFSFKSYLKDHLLIHENKRQFKCPHKRCGKSFNTNNGLNVHKFVHFKNKLECKYCSFQTKYHRYLNEHIRNKHTKQGLIKCKECGKEMVLQRLNYHIRTTHNAIKLKCTFDNCEFVTKYKCHLKYHIKRKHV